MLGSLVRLAPLLAASSLLVACSDAGTEAASEAPGSFRAVVELEDFRAVPASEDPFLTNPELAPICAGPGFFVEEQWLEIDTGLCNWVSLAAPARLAVEAGQTLRVGVSHFDLEAPSPAEGEAQLLLGGCQAWSKTVPIPSPAAVYMETFVSACSISEGDRVYFHLHNHGQNNWQLKEVALQR